MTFALQKYLHFESQLHVFYWARVKTEHLTILHQVPIKLEVPITSWVLSEPPNNIVWLVQ